MKYAKIYVEVEATQWFKNGDHPFDYAEPVDQFSPEHQKQLDWEGQIVGYCRTPECDGQQECRHCGKVMHVHGWIDTLEGGHIVCPGDWIITGVKGERYPIKPDVFALTYAEADNRLAKLESAIEIALFRMPGGQAKADLRDAYDGIES